MLLWHWRGHYSCCHGHSMSCITWKHLKAKQENHNNYNSHAIITCISFSVASRTHAHFPNKLTAPQQASTQLASIWQSILPRTADTQQAHVLKWKRKPCSYRYLEPKYISFIDSTFIRRWSDSPGPKAAQHLNLSAQGKGDTQARSTSSKICLHWPGQHLFLLFLRNCV